MGFSHVQTEPLFCDYCGDEFEHPELSPLTAEDRACGQKLACFECDAHLRAEDAHLEQQAEHAKYMSQFDGD